MKPAVARRLEQARKEIAVVDKYLSLGYPPIASPRLQITSAVRAAQTELGEPRRSFYDRVGTPTKPGIWKVEFDIEPNWLLYKAPAESPFAVEYAPAQSYTSGQALTLMSRPDNTFLFLAAGDLHAGSKYTRWDAREHLFTHAIMSGAQCHFDTGNWIDGEASFNRYDIEAHGLDRQCAMLAERHPIGLPTYAVWGDDHEGWYCFEAGTEILTQDGWRDFSALCGSELVATMTHDGMFEWQTPTRIIRKEHRGDLIRFKHRSIDVAVTPDHRFEIERKSSLHANSIRQIMTAEEIRQEFKPRCLGIIRTTRKWLGTLSPTIAIKDKIRRYRHYPGSWNPVELDARDLAEFCAWYVTEGCTSGNRVIISQSRQVNAKKHKKITDLIHRLGVSPAVGDSKIEFSSPNLSEWLRNNCGSGWERKTLPRWILDAPSDTLSTVFETMISGDGHTRKDGGYKFYTGSEFLAFQVAEIAQKLGFTTSYANGKGCLNIHIGTTHKIAYLFDRPQLEPYEGPVYCVSVSNERVFVRNNGKTFWSMNCTREGIDVGKYAESVMREAGHEWTNLGFMEAHVELKNVNTGKTASMAVVHPGGGAAYATSYAVQKIIESLEGAEKPAVALYGHFHKLWAGLIRNVWVVQTGTQCDQTPFLRKKRIEAHVGGALVRLRQDPDTGAILSMTPELIRYFNREYYTGSGRWSKHGEVRMLPRVPPQKIKRNKRKTRKK